MTPIMNPKPVVAVNRSGLRECTCTVHRFMKCMNRSTKILSSSGRSALVAVVALMGPTFLAISKVRYRISLKIMESRAGHRKS
jgi:hypothetical protein